MTRDEYKISIEKYRELMVLYSAIDGLPEEAKYLTADEYGNITWHEELPNIEWSVLDDGQFWRRGLNRDYDNDGIYKVGKIQRPPNWKDTLVPL